MGFTFGYKCLGCASYWDANSGDSEQKVKDAATMCCKENVIKYYRCKCGIRWKKISELCHPDSSVKSYEKLKATKPRNNFSKKQGVTMSISPIQTIRPNERGVVERLGKYKSYHKDGIVFVIPFLDNLIKINITEQMVDAEQQEVITKDSLNAVVDAQIYYQIESDEESIKKSLYNVDDFERQIVSLARTTLRAILGSMSLDNANSERNEINDKLAKELDVQVKKWGIRIVRAELKEIEPPDDVQNSINKVVIANKEKVAASDFASAKEIEADGMKRSQIKLAEGDKQSRILRAEGEAEQIRLLNESADKYFKGAAVEFKKLETAKDILQNNTKIIVPEGSDLVNVLGESIGLTPIVKKGDKK